MSTVKFTLPLSLAVHRGHRHGRQAFRAEAAQAEHDPAAADGGEDRSLPRQLRNSHDKLGRALRRLGRTLHRDLIGEIGISVSFNLDTDQDSAGTQAADPAPLALDMSPQAGEKAQVCPSCDASNDAHAKFCNQCGTAFPTPGA